MGDPAPDVVDATSPGQTVSVARTWRSILFAPLGDGQTRRRGTDVVWFGLSCVVVIVCWLVTRANSHAERDVVRALTPPPDGVRWLISTIWWMDTVGIIAMVVLLALISRRWAAIRDTALAGAISWLVCIVLGSLFGVHAGSPDHLGVGRVDLAFPVAMVAATVGMATAARPYLSRPLQRVIGASIVLVAVVSVVHGAGLPMAVLASLAVGIGSTAVVHLVVGSPLGLPSVDEVSELLASVGIVASELAPLERQEWGVGRFVGRVDGAPMSISIYGRDSSDAQLVTKAARGLLYRDSGPTLNWTRRQQVEHEAYLSLLARRAGARVPDVLMAGPAGPAHDALLVTRPPPGQPLVALVTDGTDDDAASAADPDADAGATPDDATLDDFFGQLASLRQAGIAHGALSLATVVVDDDGRVGLVDLQAATAFATAEQLDRDLAAGLATVALACGSVRAVDAARRALPDTSVAAALPFLQRAALNPAASRSLRGRKSLLAEVRTEGARACGIEVPALIERRRISWVNLALVAGTLIGGWALIGVLVNVGHSWSTITGADWGWVALVFVLSQAAFPAVAITTVGSVTNPLPFGRSLALELSNTFVGLAGGSMAVLATRVRFFQKQGYDATLAVSSGVVVSTASWIVKGVLFLVALPLAIGHLHFTESPVSDAHKGVAHLVQLIVLVIVVVGVVIGVVLVVPRWRSLAGAKLRPKTEEVWNHLKMLAVHPQNLVEIFGGNVAAQVLVALALGASLHAFGAHLGLATLIVVLTLGSMLGGISPVPGGMGVVEAGMILGLTAAGVNQSVAVAAVFVQRLFTAYLPPIWGWFVLVGMRRREYL